MSGAVRRRAAGPTLAAVLVAAAVLGPAASAGADPASTTTTTTSVTANGGDALTQAVELAVDQTRLTSRIAALDRQITAFRARLPTLETDFQLTDQQLTSLHIQLDDAVQRLRNRAANVYVRGSALETSAMSAQDGETLNRTLHYAQAADAIDVQEVTRLQGSVAQLTPIRDQKAQDAHDAQGRLNQLTSEHDQDAALATAEEAHLAQLGGVSVMGDSRLTASQLSGWFDSTGRTAHLEGGTSVAKLAQLYVEEGNAEHVRGDIAFAQAIIETGSFGQTRGNNFAGIGNCDSCHEQGFGFPTARDGVRAQIQLLRNYADATSRAAILAHPPSAGIYGSDPTAAVTSYDTFFLKGKVPLWNQMGNGNWATDPTYAPKVLKVYASMLTYASQNP